MLSEAMNLGRLYMTVNHSESQNISRAVLTKRCWEICSPGNYECHLVGKPHSVGIFGYFGTTPLKIAYWSTWRSEFKQKIVRFQRSEGNHIDHQRITMELPSRSNHLPGLSATLRRDNCQCEESRNGFLEWPWTISPFKPYEIHYPLVTW